MKRFVLPALLVSCLWLQGQVRDEVCDKTAGRIDSLIKVLENDNAYKLWQKSEKCQTEKFYLASENLFEALLAAPTTDAQEKAYSEQLLTVFDQYELHFPQNHNANQVKKAMFLYRKKDGDQNEAYKLLDAAFTRHPQDFTDAKALYVYFDLLDRKLLAGEKGITEDDLIEKHDAVAGQLRRLAGRGSNAREYETALRGVDALAAPAMTCDKLNVYYDKHFQAHAEDTLWLRNAAENLIARRCRKGVLLKISDRWRQLSPGMPALKAHIEAQTVADPAQAKKELDIYVSNVKDGREKSHALYSLALMSGTDYGQAIGYLKRAVAADPMNGDAYFLLAQFYVDSDCGATPLEKKALNYLAIRTVREALEKNPAIRRMAEAKIDFYTERLPSKKEINLAKKAGETITYNCGYSEMVTLPKS